jgi:hypothetical protein
LQFQVSTIGFSGITVQWDQAGSGTGPRDFALQYSLDGTAFILVNTYQVPLSTWSSSSTQSGFTFYSTFTPTIASAIEDQATLYFRLVNSSNSSSKGSTVGSAGTDRVDNFLVQATAVPEPSTFIAGIAAAAVWRAGCLLSPESEIILSRLFSVGLSRVGLEREGATLTGCTFSLLNLLAAHGGFYFWG